MSAQTPAPGRETSAASVASYALADQMPVDPEVLVGALPNGLRFYVRPNGKPARQAELRLVVKAGSVLEDDDQRGLAHFVEHMQFEGTTHFPGQGINNFLGSLGLSIGADANAETSFDQTEYTLRVPTDVPGALDRALTILEDWAGGATFDPSGIERQRPIVLSEWRMNLGADERTADKVRRVQLEGSRYADRSPIGTPETIQRATREQLMRFYRDWYRPDLMAVIVVGDVDRSAVGRMIAQHFLPLTNPSPERPRPVFDVPEHPGTRFAVVTDKETTATAVQVSVLRPARNQGSVGGYRAIMQDQLFADMLSARLDELSQSEKPPFLRAAANRSLFPAPRTKDQAIVQALVSNDGVTRGLEALVTELQRVRRFGFEATELDRAKQANMAASERVAGESPDRESSSRADEYTRNFLQQEALPTIWQELAFHRRFIPDITLSEVNALADDWFPEGNRLVVVAAPEQAGVVLPGEAQLAAVVRTASEKRVERYVDGGARPDAHGRAAGGRQHREDRSPRRGRDHRMDAVEWRNRRAQADDAEIGSDSLPGDGPGRHIASERRRIHLRPGRGRCDPRRRRRPLQRRGARQSPEREGGQRPALHQRHQRRNGRRGDAAGPRDDVPAPVPPLHTAARRSGGVRRDEIAGAGAAGKPDGEPGGGIRSGRQHRADRR